MSKISHQMSTQVWNMCFMKTPCQGGQLCQGIHLHHHATSFSHPPSSHGLTIEASLYTSLQRTHPLPMDMESRRKPQNRAPYCKVASVLVSGMASGCSGFQSGHVASLLQGHQVSISCGFQILVLFPTAYMMWFSRPSYVSVNLP